MLPKSFEQFKFVDFVNDSIVNLGFKKTYPSSRKGIFSYSKGKKYNC